MSKKDGESAFPIPGVKIEDINGEMMYLMGTRGMSLKDWFAGCALGRMAEYLGPPIAIMEDDKMKILKDVVEVAFLYADAMMEACDEA